VTVGSWLQPNGFPFRGLVAVNWGLYIWIVTSVEPPRRFAWESRSPGILVVADHIIEEASPGKCNLVLLVSFSGFLGALVGRRLRSITERYLAQEAAALKLKVEEATPKKGCA
jgi:hypothetical protein